MGFEGSVHSLYCAFDFSNIHSEYMNEYQFTWYTRDPVLNIPHSPLTLNKVSVP